jgi:hypothetical protein
MVSLSRVLFVIALLAMSSCSKLGDYTAGTTTTTTPVPSPSVSVTVPEADHEWGFENTGNDSGSVGGWTGALTGTYTNTAGEFKVGSYAAKFTTGDSFSLGAVTFPSELTISCWVRWITGLGTENTIIANSAAGASTDGFRFYVNEANGKLVLEMGSGAANVVLNSVGNLATATYTHVVVEMDNVLNQSAIYINGALDSSSTVQAGFGLNTAAFLGSMAGSTNPFNGDLDDCRIYSISLSAAQVAILYNSY